MPKAPFNRARAPRPAEQHRTCTAACPRPSPCAHIHTHVSHRSRPCSLRMQHPVPSRCSTVASSSPRLPASCTHAYLHAHTSPRIMISDPSHHTTMHPFTAATPRTAPVHEARLIRSNPLLRPRCARQMPTLAMGCLACHTRNPWRRYSDWFAVVYVLLPWKSHTPPNRTPLSSSVLVGSVPQPTERTKVFAKPHDYALWALQSP